MAYGRISVAPSSFLRDDQIVLFKREASTEPVRDTLRAESPSLLKRLIFRGSVALPRSRRPDFIGSAGSIS